MGEPDVTIAPTVFLEVDHRLGLGEPGLHTGQFLLEAGVLGEQRLGCGGLGATGLRGQQGQRPLVAQVSPFGHGGGIEPVAAQERARLVEPWGKASYSASNASFSAAVQLGRVLVGCTSASMRGGTVAFVRDGRVVIVSTFHRPLHLN